MNENINEPCLWKSCFAVPGWVQHKSGGKVIKGFMFAILDL